jgi:hypothetical protein
MIEFPPSGLDREPFESSQPDTPGLTPHLFLITTVAGALMRAVRV